MKKQPGRYSLIICHPSELPQKIEQVNALGLKWFARADYGGRNDIMLYLFFDELGLQKYLSKEWGNQLDTAAEWVKEYERESMSAIVLGERLIELFNGYSELAP